MFKRLRKLELSLAAKCQLLFGAAVLLIIGAALFVPWQRMEQLTSEVNERVARIYADRAIRDHLDAMLAKRAMPATRTAEAAPITSPAAAETTGASSRLLLLTGKMAPKKPTSFERRALDYFHKQPDNSFYTRIYNRDGQTTFHYAQALPAQPLCMSCHAADQNSGGRATGATSRPAALLGLVSISIPTQVEANELLANRVFLLIAGLLAGIVALLVFYLIITRLILQPVRVLQETAEKVSKGDLNIRSDISSGDEFQQLSETINKMLANLKAGEDQLRAINKGLDLKLGQLEESNLALYESNRLKNEFLANVSHELRTPLNSILGFAEILKDAPALAADAKGMRYIQNILSSGRNLLELINDLLDVAKIEAGRMEVRSEPLSLGDLFEGLSNIIKPLTEKKRLNIACAAASEVPIIQTDPAKLQQVLYNFLSNAIKFSPEGGQIDLKAERAGEDQVRISVTDRGPGIDPAQQALIFEKFRQIDASVTREHGGTGLGLAISKELVGLMGGKIGVQSTPGQGASFWVTLPLKIQAGVQDVRNTVPV